MKVLHLIDSLGLGGAQTIVKGILESQKENHDIFLLSLRKSEIMFEINHDNVFIFNSYALFSFLPIFKIRQIIKENKIELLHCHLMRSKVFGLIIKLFFCHRIKLLFHEHGEIFINGTKFEDWLVKFTYNRANKFLFRTIAVSQAAKQCIVKKTRIKSDKITVLLNFVDTCKFNKSNKTRSHELKSGLNVSSGIFKIGFVGRLDKVKGCEDLLRALPYLNFEYRLIVAGDGVLRRSLEELARQTGVASKVDFIGYVKQIELLYPFFDILVVPSQSESFGLSAIEAQASGVAVIASDIPGLNEIVKDSESGLLFEAGNEMNLAEKITLLYTNSVLREALADKGFEQAQKYSLQNYSNDLEKIYMSK